MDIKSARKPIKRVPQKPAVRRVDPELFAKTRPEAIRKKRSRASLRRALVRYSILGINLLIVGVFIFLVIKYSGGNAANYNARSDEMTNPLDRLNAADIAVNVARMADLPEQAAVTNYADTVNAELETFTVSRDIAQLPQIITVNLKTLADIREYVAVQGDTVSLLAERFGVTSDSIKWSNDLTNDAIPAGMRLLIPPINGFVYTVQAGDTVERLSGLYRVPAAQLIAFNDIDVTGMPPGKRIFLPGAQKPTPVFSFLLRYGNNGYDFGYCTYYAAAKAGAPPNWGHAKTWALNAAQTPGWFVGKEPVRGAIAQTPHLSFWGHVAIVEDVKFENGQYYIKYSDMNNLAGWNRVGFSEWEPALQTYQSFIYKVQ